MSVTYCIKQYQFYLQKIILKVLAVDYNNKINSIECTFKNSENASEFVEL